MFKQISILVISIFLSFIVTKQILKKKFNKFLFIPGIVKYPVKSAKLKKYAIILRLVQIALIVSQLVNDYRKCKSLLDNILLLLNLIGQTFPVSIPLPLLALADLLPGTSPERATINAIEGLQAVGIPTGTLPDGSPNLMGIYNLIVNRANDKEEAENGKILTTIKPQSGGLLMIGKKL